MSLNAVKPSMLCFQPFNFLPSTRHAVRRETMQRKGKRNRVVVKLTPSIIPQSEEIDGHYNNPMTDDQTNVVGILGGSSSLKFAKKLVEQETNLPFILCTDPSLHNGLLSGYESPSPFLYRPGKVDTDHSSMLENLRHKRVFLETSGVCCIVMPCHVSHYWYDDIKEGCSVPFLHMGECVAKELKEAKLKPMETGSNISIAVLCTDTTLVTRVYLEKLENEGFKVEIPDKNTMKHIVIPAVEALSMKDFEGAQNLVRIALRLLLIRSVNRIVLACDELRELLPPDDLLWRKCIDPTHALARSAIKYARSAKKQS